MGTSNKNQTKISLARKSVGQVLQRSWKDSAKVSDRPRKVLRQIRKSFRMVAKKLWKGDEEIPEQIAIRQVSLLLESSSDGMGRVAERVVEGVLQGLSNKFEEGVLGRVLERIMQGTGKGNGERDVADMVGKSP